MEEKCNHMDVTVYLKRACAETRYQPAEFIGHAECNICGERLDLDDIPKGAEEREG